MEERGATVTEYSLHGWVMADLAYQGILAAGPQFDREAVIEATNQFTDYTGGGMTAPVDYSRQHNPPTIDDPVTNGPAQRCFGYVTITGGEFELIGDPEKPWTCWRSEEHTSELQSLMRISYAVFCWQKKNNKKNNKRTTNY